MPEPTLTRTRLIGGVYEGLLTGAGAAPVLEMSHQGAAIPGAVTLTPGAESGQWLVRAPIPAELISDGVQTFVISMGGEAGLAADGGHILDSFTLLVGEALSEDIRAEMNLLRAELDMLKRAFRRHCLETSTS